MLVPSLRPQRGALCSGQHTFLPTVACLEREPEPLLPEVQRQVFCFTGDITNTPYLCEALGSIPSMVEVATLTKAPTEVLFSGLYSSFSSHREDQFHNTGSPWETGLPYLGPCWSHSSNKKWNRPTSVSALSSGIRKVPKATAGIFAIGVGQV